MTPEAGRGHRCRRWARCAASVAALVTLLAGTRVGIAAPNGHLHVGVPRVPPSLDPGAATLSTDLLPMRLLYEGLVAFGEKGDIEPALATAWVVSRDGLVWTFRVRPDVRLHDGTPLGVDDVVAALAERVSADEPPERAPTWVRPFRGANRLVREVRRGEGASVQVVLAQPYAPVLALLAGGRRSPPRGSPERDWALPGGRARARPVGARSGADLARGAPAECATHAPRDGR
jgi:ABC-type transport system substrate-binding protein